MEEDDPTQRQSLREQHNITIPAKHDARYSSRTSSNHRSFAIPPRRPRNTLSVTSTTLSSGGSPNVPTKNILRYSDQHKNNGRTHLHFPSPHRQSHTASSLGSRPSSIVSPTRNKDILAIPRLSLDDIEICSQSSSKNGKDKVAYSQGQVQDDRRSSFRPTSGYSVRSYISNLSQKNRRNFARFGKSKTTFIMCNALLLFISLGLTLFCIFTYLGQYPSANLIRLAFNGLLFPTTIVTGLMTLIGLIGFIGAFLHRKHVLSMYSCLLWPILATILVLGYLTFKDVHANDWTNRLSERWDMYATDAVLIQNGNSCCGFYSALDRPIASNTCTATPAPSSLNNPARFRRQFPPIPENPAPEDIPGCFESWEAYASKITKTIYICAFSSVPFILIIFIVGLLAANHIYD
ncbi:hypothetical protein DFS34DRAFT_621862 [Phlyctochytrium arcticum]|nr:hypothetical protein DFS34DRAFT_621862 [Phlyctochytrium arcticum]